MLISGLATSSYDNQMKDVTTQRDVLQLQCSRLAKLPSITPMPPPPPQPPPATMSGNRNGNQYLRREERKEGGRRQRIGEYELMRRSVRKCIAGFVELGPPSLASLSLQPRNRSKTVPEAPRPQPRLTCIKSGCPACTSQNWKRRPTIWVRCAWMNKFRYFSSRRRHPGS